MTYDKPILLQVQDPNTEKWTDQWKLHAKINKSRGSQALTAGADQYRVSLTFEVRYFSALEAVRYSPQPYRIVYRDHFFKLVDYDDYMEMHCTVRLVGEHYV